MLNHITKSFFQKTRTLNTCVKKQAFLNLTRSFVSNNDESIKNTKQLDSNNIKTLLEEAATFEDMDPKRAEDVWSTSPYPKGSFNPRDQARHFERTKIDPKDTSIILFPGQGTQYVGMGKHLLEFPFVQDLFQLASEILNYDLLKLCLEGPKEKLDQTIYSQPAIFVCSLAALEKLREERPYAIDNCVATAGFSLGELTSLVFAGSISIESAIHLVKVRAEAMQRAIEQSSPSGMMSVFYGPDTKLGEALSKAKEWCLEKGIENPQCSISNYLFPHCKIIGGHIEALKFLQDNSKTFKIRRTKRLEVSGAFHTHIMDPAVPIFAKALGKTQIDDPIVAVYSNVDGHRYKNARQIKKQLPKQIVYPVKWEQTMHVMYERNIGENFPRTFECGPDQTLKTILEQVNVKACGTYINVVA